jgi:D-methionine transport system substrate-binding protein
MRFIKLFILLLGLVACHQRGPNTLTIGTISGPETDLVKTAKDLAYKKYGLVVRVIEFNDYNLPNEALQDGSLDANIYQHLPFLEASIKAHGYAIEPIGKTFVYPTGIYSRKIKTLDDIPVKGIIAIPNDPSNETRALYLLEKAGLISLSHTHFGSLADISANPKDLRIKEIDAAQLPRVLNDVDAAVINTSFAIPAGLNPMRDAIFHEGSDSPYANLIVIQSHSDKRKQMEVFVKALNSQEVRAKAKELFGDAAIPAW